MSIEKRNKKSKIMEGMWWKMLNDEICKLREKLNKSIEQEDDYQVTYQLSIELDQLIAQYYGQGF